jgi:hypothetical protein
VVLLPGSRGAQPRVGWQMGHAGWRLAKPSWVAGLCAEEMKKKADYWAALGEKRRFRPRHFGKIEYLLLFSNLFTIHKAI